MCFWIQKLNYLIKSKWLLVSSAVVYIIIYFIYYPQISTIIDELCYLNLAYALRVGTLYLDQADLGIIHYGVKIGSHLVNLWPIGNSILLLPFTFGGGKTLFLYGLIFHILGYILFIKVLKECKIDTKFALLYLFYPPQIFITRTLLSDIPAAFFTLLGFYFYQKQKFTSSGIAFGISFLIRYGSIFFFSIFPIFALIQGKRKFLKMIIGLLPFLGFMVIYNYIVYKKLLPPGYINEEIFAVHRRISSFGVYILLLSIFYPLMIFSPIFYKNSYKYEIQLSCITTIIGYSLISYALSPYSVFSLSNFPRVVFMTTRFFFPITPLLFITYISLCKKYLNKKIWIGILIILIGGCIGIHHIHNEYLKFHKKCSDIVYSYTTKNSLIICKRRAWKLISRVWGKRKAIILKDKEKLSPTLLEDDIWLVSFDRAKMPEIDKKKWKLVKRIVGFGDTKFELYKIKKD